jgi:cell fate regulator YaaT (PSP1 superfamily)
MVKSTITQEAMEKSQRKYPLEILHKARPEESEQLEKNRCSEEEAIETCRRFVEFRGMEMKLVDVEFQFDGNKMTFYFTADHRIDFRELVKDLASAYRTRIELRQIGVRDETKKMGGIGQCGLELCCSRWLKQFSPISTQYARDQNLAVNPGKLSGPCGRLFCCLDYEENFYEEIRKNFPKIDERVTDGDGRFTVCKIDPFKMNITIRNVENDNIEEISQEEFNRRFKKRDKNWLNKWLPDNTQEKK